LAARREMMQRWADYLDKLRLGDEVVPLRSVGERSGMQLVFLEGIEFSQLLFLAFTQQFPLSSS
jgi:hypothetical protein